MSAIFKTQSVTINIPTRRNLIEITPELEGIIANVFEEYSELKNEEWLRSEIQNSKKLDVLISSVNTTLA